MNQVKDIEDAVAALTPSDYANFRAWFETLDASRFDTAIARDVAKGGLDGLAEQALKEAHEGRVRDL